MFLLLDTDIQVMYTLHSSVMHDLPKPAVTVVVVGDVLVNGKIKEAFRRTRVALLANPTQVEVKKTAAQLQAEIGPLLWQNINIERE